MLYIFGGLPGTGKSTLAAALAHDKQALYLRIDTIEQALRTSNSFGHGAAGYNVAYQVAADNLRLGQSVIADCVNPLYVTREAWRAVARQEEIPFVEIEVICSNRAEHRARVESRRSDIPGHELPTWQAVEERDYQPWEEEHIMVDTAGQTVGQSMAILLSHLDNMLYKSA